VRVALKVQDLLMDLTDVPAVRGGFGVNPYVTTVLLELTKVKK
jgi:hypothetical protein